MRVRAPRPRFWLLLLAGWIGIGCVGMPGRAPGQEDETRETDRDRLIMERFLTLLEKSPRRGTALDRVYGFHVERGTLDALIKRYEDRTAKDPGDGVAWLLLGLFEAQRGHDAAAVAALRQAEAKRPDDPLASYYLGQTLVLIGQPDAAAEAFERALTRKPARADLLDVFQALGRVYQRAHRNEQALAVWARLEALFPDDLRVQEQIASALAEESQLDQALTRYEALADRTRDPYRKVQFRIEAADLKLRLGRSADALKSFEALLGTLEPESWLHREVRRRIEDVFLRNDDQAGLANYYERWIEKNPDDVEVMTRLGRALAAQGRATEARTWFDRAVKLAPSRKEIRLALIEQLVQEKKYSEAAAQYEILSKADPSNPDLIRDWGRLLLRDTSLPDAARKARAADVWRRLVAARPNDPAIATQVADLFRQASMPDEAIALYRKAVELAPDSPQYREYLGEYYHTLKRPDDALAAWRPIAEGKNRSAANLLRLAEVLAGFSYRDQAIATAADACALEPDRFDLRIRYADWLHDAQRYTDADAQLNNAAQLADTHNDEDERETVIDRRIKNDQAAGKLADRIASLRKEIEDTGDGDKPRASLLWRRLARYLEAEHDLNGAIGAIERSIALDERSIPSLAVSARLYESAGRLGEAADVSRKLAGLDRRARTDYLTSVARLEARLGRRDEALKAGRDLLAAAPGNPEHAQFFADLCFQLGAADEGLETLRRAARANATDPQALLSLAEALAREFRTEEAIELYWRAFDRTGDLDGKLGLISRLTELYLQRNQFDRLITRLERLRQEGDQQREATLCIAQAHAASGDLTTARQEVEQLLTAHPRDTALLQQLSTLAENEGELADAARYQKQLNDIAPSDEAAARLAQLYLRSGEVSEAEALWSRLATDDQDASRILQAIDSLASHGKDEAALEIADRLVRKDPDDWEALYRQARALAALDRTDEAARSYQALLDLRHDDDEEGAIARAKSKSPTGLRLAGTVAARSAVTPQSFPARNRMSASYMIQMMLRMQPGYSNYSIQSNPWSPSDFSQARMASLGWLYTEAHRTGTGDDWLNRLRTARDEHPGDPRPARDWYYLQLLRQEGPALLEAAHALVRITPDDPEALWSFLYSLLGRTRTSGIALAPIRSGDAEDKTPPLPAAELDEVVAAYRSLRRLKPEWRLATFVTTVVTELKRAGRDQEVEALVREEVDSANDPQSVSLAAALAADTGDVEELLKLFDTFERFQQGQRLMRNSRSGEILTPSGYVTNPATSMARAMYLRADARDYHDILRLLDRYLASLRNPDRHSPARRGPSSATANAISGMTIYLSKRPFGVRIDYPAPDEHLDFGAIQLLRNAFELYRRDDLLSDLVAHFRKPIEAKAPEEEQFQAHLVLSALRWWSSEKADAVKELEQAVKLAPEDPELRIRLAELKAQTQETEEALAVLDSVDPLDQATLQRRELLALRLAVMTGNIDRARKAAERLFGLRLDTTTQIELAAQMHQLGMHDLAEAVLARARRHAGSNAAALSGLMRQYQAQGKTDVATQIALQLLRREGASRSGSAVGGVVINGESAAHREAIQVLARSGKLREMVERTEAQIARAPQSLQLHQTLATFYQAAGQADKLRETIATMARLRPDDARLQYELATQLLQASRSPADAAAAVELYRTALKKEPSLFANRYYEVQNAFQRANKLDELVALIEGLDPKVLGNSYSVMNLIDTLVRDPRNIDKGMSLIRKAWDAFPNERNRLIAGLYNDAIWKRPEMYDLAREALIPGPSQTLTTPWQGVDQIMAWSSTLAYNATDRLLDAAAQQNRLDDLSREVSQALEHHPDWLGGKALRALARVRQGKADDAKSDLEALAKEKAIPEHTRIIIGQEIENNAKLRPIAIAFYEGAIRDKEAGIRSGSPNGFQYTPANRLVALYRRDNREEEARDLILEYLDHRGQNENIGYPPDYEAYRKISDLASVGNELLSLGFPADAIRLFSEILGSTEEIHAAQRYFGNNAERYIKQIQDQLNKALVSLNPTTLAPTLKTLLEPKSGSKDNDRGAALDLVLLVHPRTLDRAALTSLLDRTLHSAASQPELLREATTRLEGLVKAYPEDLSVQTAAALLAAITSKDDPKPLAEAAGRLERLAEKHPLDDLSEGAKPNARQRAEAARQLPLWLVARACLEHDATRDLGRRLAARALAAAERQSDPLWTLALLRESGQTALDRGDRTEAEAHWSKMLDLVLAGASGPRGNQAGQADAPMPPVPIAPPPSTRPVPPIPPAPKGAAQKRAIRKTAQITETTTTRQRATATSRPAAGPGAPARAQNRNGLPVLTLERFEQAMEIARLAAEHEMHALSLRAVREALKGGPPVTLMPIQASQAGTALMRITSSSGSAGTSANESAMQQVETRLGALSAIWARGGAPAVEVYEALRVAVLPEARPTEVFLYPAPMTQPRTMPPRQPSLRSVGQELATWAVRAGRADDLRRQIEARGKSPMAQLPAEVLRAQLADAEHAPDAANAALDAIGRRLAQDTLQTSAELACHAALPALADNATAPAAANVLAAAVKNLAVAETQTQPGSPAGDPLGSLLRTLARYQLEHGQLAEARGTFRDYLASVDRAYSRYVGDYPLRQRKQAYADVTNEYIRFGAWAEALEMIGDYADAPLYQGEPSIGGLLAATARHLAGRPAAERYERLRDWTLPTAERQSIRLLTSFVTRDAPPAAFGVRPLPASTADGLASTATLLIDAARDADRLDALADALRPLAEKKVENAQALLLLAEIARGRASAVEPTVRAIAEGLKAKIPPETRLGSPESNAVRSQTIDWSDVLITRACLNDKSLGDLGEAMIGDLITHARRLRSTTFEAFLYREQAAARAARAGANLMESAEGRDPGLALWHNVDPAQMAYYEAGKVPPWWVAHEGHVRRVTGPSADLLLFDYPLTGKFSFSVDATNLGWAEGHLSYGGLIFEAMAPPQPGSVIAIGARSSSARFPRTSPFLQRGTFNRLTLKVEPGKVRCLINGHLYYETDQFSPTFPWLALYSPLATQAVFHNPRLAGHPEVPREVRLTHGDRLDGWDASFHGETTPPNPFLAAGQPETAGARVASLTSTSPTSAQSADPNSPAYDWSARDGGIVGGEILGRRLEEESTAREQILIGSDGTSPADPLPSRLTYYRPLRDRESIAYEFFYEPGRTEVHPALDRLAFLLEPEGVRLHWMTQGGTIDGSGLSPGNAIDVPAERRGQGPLPLKPKDWNALRLALKNSTVRIELNGTLIYERPIDAENSRQFGLYHDKGRTEARVRAVVLRGDWPSSLPAEQLARLFAPRDAEASPADRRARHDLIGEMYLGQSFGALLDSIRDLTPEARYEALAAWVLPGEDHPELRLAGEYTPTNPVPPGETGQTERRVMIEGTLRAPVRELLAVARELGKLDALAGRVDELRPASEFENRSRLALRALIAMAREDDAGATALLGELSPLVAQIRDEVPYWRRWPELVAATAALERPGTRPAALALLDVMVKHLKTSLGDDWNLQVRATHARARRLLAKADSRTWLDTETNGGAWTVVTPTTARSRGSGSPAPAWFARKDELIHEPGHESDGLYFNVPLRGDFEVAADLLISGTRAAQLVWGSERPDAKGAGPARAIKSPPEKPVRSYAYRLVVRQGVATSFVNGSKVRESHLPADPDPWLALFVFSRDNVGARNLTIRGKPEVPDQLRLSTAPNLAGWRADSYEEPIGGTDPMWEKRGEEIVGHRFESAANASGENENMLPPPPTVSGSLQGPGSSRIGIPGSRHESVLQYHRPLLEDGVVSYEFYYEDGKAMVHPALDRLTFLLEPEGVAIHWMTDAKYDRTGLDPGNATTEPSNRRGPDRLPLKPRDWNRVELTLTGDVVTLRLNDTLIEERPLEPSNDRTFGLFHFADTTEARVRNVTYRGAWPRTLPDSLISLHQ